MGRLTSLLLLLLLVGSGCKPRATEAAVRLKVSYNFKVGCITVLARDANGQGQETSEFTDLARESSEVVLAVFRKEDWSHTLEITTTAHELTCDGAEVAQEVRIVELDKKGDIKESEVTLTAHDTDEDGYMAEGTDCDDNDKNSRPGLNEACDGRDNDCDGNIDQGLPTRPWYPDRDDDGFGDRDATALMSCAEPANTGNTRYVQNNTDCGDSDAEIYPRPGLSEALCDEVDNDCDGEKDDGFAKGAACSNPCPGGKYVCNASHNGVSCVESPAPALYYPDVDGDGAGNENITPSNVCPNETAPTGFVANKNDCDDLDKHNLRGKAEVCDDRDNNCDTQRDEGDICGGKGWKVLDDAALTGNSRQWKTVAIGPGGLPVWVAGDNGALAVRTAAGQAFKSLDGGCGNHNWRAAWVRPANGHVLLAGEGGRLAEHDGINVCYNQATLSPSNNVTGLIEFNQSNPPVYLVEDKARMYAWTPGTLPEQRYNEAVQTYFGIHGLAPTQLLAVGGATEDNEAPYIASYSGSGGLGSVVRHTLNNVPGNNPGPLRAVWMGASNLAYAVGDTGQVMRWDGATNWNYVNPPSDNTTAPFSSVVVLDPSSIYVTDATTNGGSIRRLNAAGTWFTATTVNKPLRDIALSSPSDIWAVGDNGNVVHFPE
ncbi:putative metal-binding motif-containing protein [Archangium violaceum]|uniref:putative metal-binding motif-containing protein n=1 Tax=Archangium violaceum TaxID=83451 RepID=UPI001951E6FE|nr:putative metal-binding motif-containing protein [Archangium violaceum]QRN93640.1 putative metal-binding motif-containing protein [Archangium violaceum]